MFQDGFFDHRVVSLFLFGGWAYRERTTVFFVNRVWTTNAIQLLFEYLWQECTLNESSFPYIILHRVYAVLLRKCRAKANLLVTRRSIIIVSALASIVCIEILLLDCYLLLLFILEGNKIEKVSHHVSFDSKVDLHIGAK